MDKARLGRSRRDSRVFNSEQQLTEFGTHNRSLASRLGMPDMSCFPGTRSRRPSSHSSHSSGSGSSSGGAAGGNTTDVYDLSKSSSQRRMDYVGRSSGTASLMARSRSLERGKGQVYAQGVYLRDNELAVEEEAESLEAEEENEDQVSDSDDVFELRHIGSPYPGIERLQTYRSPVSADAASSSSSVLRTKRKCCRQVVKTGSSSSQSSSPTIFNSRRVFMGSSSSSPASAATSSSSRASLTGAVGEVAVGQKPRFPRNTSSPRACSSVRPGTAVPMEQEQTDRSLNSRRLSSLMNSSSESREMRLRLRRPSTGGLSPPPPSIRSSMSSRGPPPLGSLRSTVSSRLHQVENTEVPAYSSSSSSSRRTGIRRTNVASSLLPGDRFHGRQQGSSSSNLFTRRNISHCFPAFGGNSGRRTSSPLLREPSQASGYSHFHGADEGYTQVGSASSSSPSTSSASPGPLSLLAAALEMMPSSSGGYQVSGREQQQSPSDAMASSHEQSWPSSFGWEYHRPRLMAEGLAKVLMALERMENDDDLTHEQLLMLEATVLFGGMSLHDEHRDWRLDVDNMSYEELLALGDRIGSVNTGLSDEVVSSRLVRSKFSSVSSSGQDSEELKCSICQEEYAQGEELGSIECGHKYHAACISQWLVQKNLCPICKAAAVTN